MYGFLVFESYWIYTSVAVVEEQEAVPVQAAVQVGKSQPLRPASQNTELLAVPVWGLWVSRGR